MTEPIETIKQGIEHLEYSIRELSEFYQNWEETKRTTLAQIKDYDGLVEKIHMMLQDHTRAIKSHLKLKDEWIDVRELRKMARHFEKYVMMPERMHALSRNTANLMDKLLKIKELLPKEEVIVDAVTEIDVITRLTQDQQHTLYKWLEENEQATGPTSR